MWVFVLLALGVVIVRYFIYPLWTFRKINQLPGLPRHFLMGNLMYVPTDQKELFRWSLNQQEKYGQLRRFWAGPAECFVIISNPEDVKTVLSDPKNIKKNWAYRFLVPWLGYGLLTSTGQQWQAMRKVITPAFHYQILETYTSITNKMVDIFLEKMEQRTSKKEFFNICPDVQHLALDIIGLAAFGSSFDAQKNPENAYVQAIAQVGDLIRLRIRSPWFWNDTLYYNLTPQGRSFQRSLKILHQFTVDVIKQRQQKRAKDEQANKDFLDILLSSKGENNTDLPFEQIRAEVDTFMFEGHDTTSHGLIWTLYHLASNPKVQERAWEEVNEYFSRHPHEHIDHGALKLFPYLNKVINESLRISPPVPMIARDIDFPITLSNGMEIPGGTSLQIAVSLLHLSKQTWGADAEEFNPNRFDRISDLSPFAFVPFSGGQRNCIGQKFAMNEMLVVLARFLRRFSVHPDPDPESAPIRTFRLVLTSANGVSLRVTSRSKQD